MVEKIIEVIADQLSIDASKITAESSLVDDLKADSLDIAALMLDLEEEYNIEIPDEDLVNLKTVGSIADYISAKVSK
jgi:acyl carrier protein